MSWQEWEPAHKALTALAKREQPDRTCWFANTINSLDFQCLICGETISNKGVPGLLTNQGLPRHYNTLREHGLEHLKERNLLPFL